MTKLERRMQGIQKARRLLRIIRGSSSYLHKQYYVDVCGNPRRHFGQPTRQEVLNSLEQSITDNADTWRVRDSKDKDE